MNATRPLLQALTKNLTERIMTKEELLALIEKKEQDLLRAEQESDAWNKGKLKQSSNSKISKNYVESLRKEIAKLYEKLNSL